MDSNEIEDILSYDKHFMGCFASNQLPSVASPFPKSLIINTAPSNTVGEHWVALVLNKNKCFYFDSFGLPVLNQDILHFLCKYKKVTYTDVCIQSTISDYCGKFCIAFINSLALSMFSGVPISNQTSPLDITTEFNSLFSQ